MTSVLFLMPNWNAPSELFIERQIRMLAEGNILESIVTIDSGDTLQWQGGIPVHNLIDKSQVRRVLRAIARRVGLEWFKSKTRLEMLRKLIKSSKADTIFCQYAYFAVQLKSVLEKSGKRLFIHIHGYNPNALKDLAVYREALINLGGKATLICNSRETYCRLVKWGIHPESLVIKYCGVEVPSAPTKRHMSSEVTVLHVGRLVDCKSPDRTMKAFELACDWGLRGRLIIAGDGPLRMMCELLRARSKWRDRIKILGAFSSDQGADLFSKSDIFSLHSVRGELSAQVESFGVAVVEAMAASLPVISCRIGGIKEIVVDQETGFLLHPGDVDAHASAIVRLATDPDLRCQMGQAGWRRAKEHFSFEKERLELLSILGADSSIVRSGH